MVEAIEYAGDQGGSKTKGQKESKRSEEVHKWTIGEHLKEM